MNARGLVHLVKTGCCPRISVRRTVPALTSIASVGRPQLQRYYSSSSIKDIDSSSSDSTSNTTTTKPIAKNQAPQLNRFWKKVDLQELDKGFVITLDGRKLKTPDGHMVVIPHNKKTLALLVAAEWEAQEKVLKSYSLPLTSIVVRALDSFPDKSIRAGVIDNLIRFFKTDTICYMQDEPQTMVDMQNEYWTPLISWCDSKFNLSIATSNNSIMGVTQSQESLDKFKVLLETYDDLTLAALEKAVTQSKSFIIGLALIHRVVSVESAAIASRLEVLHQIKRWGEVEDSHDVDREDLMRQLGAVVCSIMTNRT